MFTSEPNPTDTIVVIPVEGLINWSGFVVLISKSPWISSRINSLIPVTAPNDSCIFLPNASLPIVGTDRTSPTWYPDPPALMVAAIATPFVPLCVPIVMSAVAFLPFPLKESKDTPVKVNWLPSVGVYPIPALIILRSPVAEPPAPT